MPSLIFQSDTIVGIDAEWRPSFAANLSNKMALLQLATRSNIFLLDMLVLQNILIDQDWYHLAASVFANDDVLKLGRLW